MNHHIEVYLNTMLWLSVLNVVNGAVCLVADHPRHVRPVNVGTDALRLITAMFMLAWVFTLIYVI